MSSSNSRGSGSSSQIRRTKSSSHSGTKQRKYVCQGCYWRFSSREKLVAHMVDSRNGTPCTRDLQQCLHCNKFWPSKESLDAHLRMDMKCKRAENIPYTVSFVKTNTNNEDSDRSSTKTSSTDKTVQKMKVTHHGSTPELKVTRHSTICNKNVCHSKESVDLQANLIKFKEAMRQQSPNLYVDVHELVHKGDICPEQLLVGHLLLNTSLCDKMGILNLKGLYKSLVLEFRNTKALFSLNGDLQIFDGCEGVTSEVTDHDLETFLMTHGTWNIMTSDVDTTHQGNSNNEAVSVGNGSMVYDLVIGGDFKTDHDQTSFHSSSSGSGEDSMTILGDKLDNDDEIVDSTMLDFQKDVASARATGLFDETDIASADLYHILKKASSPKYLFDKILCWVERNVLELQHVSSFKKRKSLVKDMSEKIYGKRFSKCSIPCQTHLVLPSSREIPITLFSLRTSIASILLDDVLMNPKNLLINPDNKFGIQDTNDNLEDVNSGWWHSKTQAEVCTQDNHILLPLILFIDGATIDKMGKMQVEPVSFTLGILNRKTRTNAQAWRTLGYIENFGNVVDSKDGITDSKKVSSKVKMQDYHAIIGHIMREFHELQGRNGGFKWKLTWNGKSYDVVFKIAVQTVIGDCKGNDALCGRYGSHGIQVKSLCRDCRVLTSEADDSMHVCRWITRDDIQGASKEELESLSFHNIENAFNEIYMGANGTGITECTSPEPLHGFKLGMCKYLYEGFCKAAAPKTLRLISSTVKAILEMCGSQAVKNLPSLSTFRNGVDVSHVLTAKESYARIFGIYLCLMDQKVMKSLAHDDRHIRVKDSETCKMKFVSKGPLGLRMAFKWFKIIEDTVLYDAWLMKPSHKKSSVLPNLPENSPKDLILTTRHDSPALARIRKYLTDYKALVKRDGNGLKIPKFHQNLHYPRQILKDGSLLNIDGGRPESHNKANIKDPAKISQKNQKTISTQIALNYHKDLIMTASKRHLKGITMSDDTVSDVSIEDKYTGSQFHLTFECRDYSDHESFGVWIEWKGKKVKESLNSHLCKCVAARLFLHTGEGGCLHKDSVVRGYTEFAQKEVVYRAHPSFRGGKCCHHFALIKWEEVATPMPARIIMFLDISDCKLMSVQEHRHFCEQFCGEEIDENVDHGYYYLTNQKWIVVQSTLAIDELPEDFEEEDLPYQVEARIAERFYFEDGLRILPVSAITGPAYCVLVPSSLETNSSQVIHVKDKEEWSKRFLPGF